jgi:hypothetical protein
MGRQHAGRVTLVLVSCLVCTACARVTALEGPPQDLQALSQAAVDAPPPAPTLQPQALPVGPEVPYTPILQPPRVQRVWVPDHLNAAGDLVGGHWVYLLLEPFQWFLETYPPAPTPTLRVPLAPPVPLTPPALGSTSGASPGPPGVVQAPPPVASGPGTLPAQGRGSRAIPRGQTPRKGSP